MNHKKFEVILLQNPAFQILAQLTHSYDHAELFMVGGAVRDILRDVPPVDVDFVLRGIQSKDIQKFLQAHGKVSLVGKVFGVFKFVPRNCDEEIDIALPRTEVPINNQGGYRDFEIHADHTLPIEKDLMRRDFTMNAIAYDVLKKVIIDPFHGKEDIRNKIIRTVQDPHERFAEDRTRLLRAIRFSVTLGFKIEKKTWKALQSFTLGLGKSNIGNRTKIKEPVSREMIASELVKMFNQDPVTSLEMLDQCGFLAEIFPEIEQTKDLDQPGIYHSEGDVFSHIKLIAEKYSGSTFQKRFGTNHSKELIFAVLFHDIGKINTQEHIVEDGIHKIRFHGHDVQGEQVMKNILARLKFASVPGFDVDKIIWILKHHMFCTTTNLDEVKAIKLENLFLKKSEWGIDLLKTMYLDISSSLPSNGEPSFKKFDKLTAKINNIRSLASKEKDYIPPLLTGHDLKREFRLDSGPRLGSILLTIREAQLQKEISTKKQALELARKLVEKN